MNRFNKRARDNVKEKRRQKRDSHRDREAARDATRAAAEGVAVVPKATRVKLAVSGIRTGKHRRATVRRWQKSRAAAIESGALSMEDIVMYAAASSSSAASVPPGQQQTQQQPNEISTKGMEWATVKGSAQGEGSKSMGFRVKPSKKARLRLKRRGAPADQVSKNGTTADEMLE